MAVYFLYYTEEHPGLPVTRTFADHIVGHMFGYSQVIIDPSGEQYVSTDSLPLVLRSLDEARSHPWLKDLHWVYLHSHAKKTLQEYKHPEDNVIYCVGSDWTGLGVEPGSDEKADFLRLAAPDPSEQDHQREFFGSAVIPLIAYDRALKLWQHQHSPTI